MLQSSYIEVNGQSIYTSASLPEGSAKGNIIICEPIAEEKRCAYRMLFRLAETFSELGYAVLRFDYSGTGNSSGLHQDATLQQWLAETKACIGYLAKLTHSDATHIMGFRAGAFLAAMATTSEKCQSLSLVEPVISGAALLKEMEMRQHIQDMMNEKSKQNNDVEFAPITTLDTNLPNGYKNLGGFTFSGQMLEEIANANLQTICNALHQDTAIRLLHVSGASTFPPAWKETTQLALNSPNGKAEIIKDKPFWGQVDYFESDAVIDWLKNNL